LTIEFSCSHCNKVLKTSDDKAGRRAKCPQCGEPIDVPFPEVATDDGFDEFDAETPVSEEQSFLADSPVGSPVDSPVREQDSFLAEGNIDCPMCGSSIQASATKCQFCGETLKSTGRNARQGEPRIIKVGDVISRAWELFKSNLGMCLAAPLLAMLIYFFCVIVVSVGLGVIGAILGREFGQVAEVPLMLLMNLVFYLIVFYLQLGVQMVFLKIVKGENPEISLLFGAGPYLGRMFLCSIIFGIVTTLGYILLIIPGIILALMFWPYPYLLIDRNLPGIQSFTESRKITQGNLLNLFGVFLASLGIILLGGLLTLGIGFIFLLPFAFLIQTVAYAEMTSQ